MKKPDLFLIISDAVLAGIFWIITLLCIYGIASGAWWHIGTATGSLLAVYFLIKELKKECRNGRTSD